MDILWFFYGFILPPIFLPPPPPPSTLTHKCDMQTLFNVYVYTHIHKRFPRRSLSRCTTSCVCVCVYTSSSCVCVYTSSYTPEAQTYANIRQRSPRRRTASCVCVCLIRRFTEPHLMRMRMPNMSLFTEVHHHLDPYCSLEVTWTPPQTGPPPKLAPLDY